MNLIDASPSLRKTVPKTDARIEKLEFVDEFATEPVRGVLFTCKDLPGDVCKMTTGTDKETIERNADEDQESFRARIEARMEALYQQDKTVPVAYLFPDLMS